MRIRIGFLFLLAMQQPSNLSTFADAMNPDPAQPFRFEQRKVALLDALSCGVDKSKKGSFDQPISEMLEHINLHPAYVTTSSCSGRIALFLDTSENLRGKGGKGGTWLLCVHGEVNADQVLGALENAQTTEGFVFFKTEPFILHVQCKSLDAATKFLEVAKAAGFRESGISPGKKHTIVGIRTSSLKMDVPIMKDGVVLVSRDYISMLVQMANEKFAKNREKSDEFYRLLQREILKTVKYPQSLAGGIDLTCGTGEQSDDDNRLWALVCHGSDCEEFRNLALSEGHLDKSRRNVKLADGRIALPITAGGAAAVRNGHGGLGAAVESGRAELSAQDQALPAGRGVGLSPHASLRTALKQLLEDAGLGEHGDESAWQGVPRHWEEYGDLVLLPEGSLGGHPWQLIGAGRLWESVARGLGVRRVALKAEVDSGPMRQSRVVLVHAPDGDGWVQVPPPQRATARPHAPCA